MSRKPIFVVEAPSRYGNLKENELAPIIENLNNGIGEDYHILFLIKDAGATGASNWDYRVLGEDAEYKPQPIIQKWLLDTNTTATPFPNHGTITSETELLKG